MSGRLLVAHWPALVAWYLAGTLGRYVGLEVAGYVGGYTAIGGILLIPLAILAKLISVVAMFLVLRDGMVRLGVVAPVPTGSRERRAAFRDALVSSVLPFIAVYAALGFLRDDVAAYLDAALKSFTSRSFGAPPGVTLDRTGAVDSLTWEPWTIAVVILAFAGRWAWNRYKAKLPRWTALIATYLEGLWVFLTAYFIGEALGQATAWVDSRQAMVWLADAREWVGGWFAPLGWAWDAVGVLLAEAGQVLLVPLAWLTIAGVIYGQAVTPQGVQWRGELAERARSRYGTVPQRLRRRLADLGSSAGARFRPIWRAIVLMWRGGPILIGGYVLAYALVVIADRGARFGLTRLIGPQDFWTVWLPAYLPVVLVVSIVTESVRTVVIASAYDATVGSLIGAPAVAPGHPEDDRDSVLGQEAQIARELVRDDDVDAERPVRVSRDEEGDLDPEPALDR